MCLNKPEYALKMSLNMHEYALITLNMIEYVAIYLKKQSAEYARILYVSDAVHSIRSLYKYQPVIETEAYSDHCQTFKMERFLELWYFDKHILKNTRQRGPRRETFWKCFS